MKHRFYKENGMWYIDLPAFLEAGLGTKANLLMVAGADTLLDILSGNKMNASKDGAEVTLEISNELMMDYDTKLNFLDIGKDQQLLDSVGHAPIDYGAYYVTDTILNIPYKHKLWLCPVTEYVFGGGYPSTIYVKKIG